MKRNPRSQNESSYNDDRNVDPPVRRPYRQTQATAVVGIFQAHDCPLKFLRAHASIPRRARTRIKNTAGELN